MADFYLSVDGRTLKCPSKFGWSLQDVSSPNSGRNEAGFMEKGRICQKEKIQLEWAYPNSAETASILQAFQPEYFNVTYHSPLTNGIVTKQFYCGDRSAPAYWWVDGGRMESVSFDIIER